MLFRRVRMAANDAAMHHALNTYEQGMLESRIGSESSRRPLARRGGVRTRRESERRQCQDCLSLSTRISWMRDGSANSIRAFGLNDYAGGFTKY